MSAETLRKAAQILREKGWTQREVEDHSGRMCALGVLRCAHFGVARRLPTAQSRVMPYYADLTTVCAVIGGGSLIVWNDTPGRTAEEVIAALESAADRLEAS